MKTDDEINTHFKVENWETDWVKRGFVIKDQRILSLWERSNQAYSCQGPRNKTQNVLGPKCPRFLNFVTSPEMILLDVTRTWMTHDRLNRVATGQSSQTLNE